MCKTDVTSFWCGQSRTPVPTNNVSKKRRVVSLPLRGRGTADAASAVDEVFGCDVTSFYNGGSSQSAGEKYSPPKHDKLFKEIQEKRGYDISAITL